MSTLKVEILVKPEGSKYLIWTDITRFVEQGLTITDVADGTFDSGKFTADFIPGEVNFDVTEAIPPRTPVKISEYEPGILEPQVQFILQTADNTSVPLRFEQIDDKGEVTAFYTHTVNLIELTKETEGKFPPNLSITQPKHIFADAYKRDVSFRFALPTRNKSLKLLEAFEPFDTPLNVDITRNLNNATGVIAYDGTKLVFETQYDVEGRSIAGPAREGYSVVMNLKMSASAPQIVKTPRFGIGFLEDIRRIYISRNDILKDVLPLDIKVKVKYYDINSVVIDSRESFLKVEYYGDGIIREMSEHGPAPVIGSGEPGFIGINTSVVSFNIPRNASADRVEVEFEWKPDLGTTGGYKRLMYVDKWGPGHSQQTDKAITYYGEVVPLALDTRNVFPVFTVTGGIPVPTYHYYYPDMSIYSVEVNVLSSVITETQLDTYITALDIVQKALNEINLRQAREYRLSRRFKQLLEEEVSPEMTLEEYSLKEVLYKYGRIVNVVPVLGDPDLLDPDEDVLTTISYIKPGENVYDFSISEKEYIEVSNEVVLSDFYSTIASRLRNVVSEQDYHTEKVALQADTEGFTQLTEANMAFLPTVPVYWVRRIKIKGLQIPAKYRDDGSMTNINVLGNDINYEYNSPMQSWDFTERCLEEDIWNALPDVNYVSPEARELGMLSRGNTISYKSGTRSIHNLGHRSPDVPNYHPPFTRAVDVANLAVVEAAAVLAIQTWAAYLEDFEIDTKIDLGLDDLKFLEAEVTYTPLDEFMYRHTLDDPKRRHIDIEHRVNAQDKVLSLRDTAEMMIMEQNKKGHNQVVSQTLIHTSIASCYKTGWKTKNGYVITSRVITKFNEYVQCAYTLAKNFVVQSDHVGLDVKYERYAIPYEHIMREVLNYTHIMISQKASDLTPYAVHIGTDATTKYLSMVLGWEEAPKEIFGLAELTYAHEIQSDREAIFKLHKLTDQRVLMYIGKWVDNYSAGNQVVEASTGMYNQPYRYSDSTGKVQTIRYEVFKNIDFDIRKYPHDPDALTFNKLLGSDTQQSFESGDLKDAREAYEFNITGSIEDASDDEILIFSTRGLITHLAILSNDPASLSYATKFTDLQFKQVIQQALVLEAPTGETEVRTFRIKVPASYFDGYTNEAIALYYGAGQTEPALKYIFKEPYLHREGSDMILEFYAIPTRGGYEYNDMYVSDRHIDYFANSLGVTAEIDAYKLAENSTTFTDDVALTAEIDVITMEYPIAAFSAGVLVGAEIDEVYFEYPVASFSHSLGVSAAISFEAYQFTQHALNLASSLGVNADISITKTEEVTQLAKPIISVSHEGSSTIIVNVYNPNSAAAYIYHSTGSGYTKVTPALAAYGSRSLTITRPYGTSAFYLYVNLSDATGYYDSADASVYVSAYVATYTVTFKDWNNNTLKTQTVSQGGDATPPSQPSVGDCYFWAGWSGNYTNVQKNETVIATRVIKQFTVTFVRAWTGGTIKSQTVNCGSSATWPTDAQIDYGTGWQYDYHSGNYQSVTKNETVVIYRKSTGGGTGTLRWVDKGPSAMPFCPAYPDAGGAEGQVCSAEGAEAVYAAPDGESCRNYKCEYV